MGKASKKKRPPVQAPEKKESGQSASLTAETVNLPGSKDGGADERGRSTPSAAFTGGGIRHKPVIHVLIIAVLGLLAYSNTFRGPFQWDEASYLVNNPFIRSLDYFKNPSRAEVLLDNALISRYVGYLTFALNYRLHGFDVVGYHVVNLAVHLINAILVYFLVLFTFRTPFFVAMGNGQWAIGERQEGTHKGIAPAHYSPFTIHGSRFFAFAVALLFVAHPLQTEAVTYVFQRFASLVSLFYLLSLVLYIKGRLRQASASRFFSAYTFACFFLSFISAVLAMKTKENAFTLPLVITLYEFLFFSGPLKSRALRLLPFLLTMFIIPATLAGFTNTAAEVISQMKDPSSFGYQKLLRAEYLYTQFRVIVTYIRLLFLPANQNIDYDYLVYKSFFDPAVLLSFLFLLSIFGTAVYLLYRSRLTSHLSRLTCSYYRLIAFGILWFFITLSVESSIIPIPMVINEYRAYLPSVGFFLAVVSGVLLLFQNFPVASLQKLKIAAGAFALVILLLASATYARNTLWADKVSLWEDVVLKNPASPRGYSNLGIAYYEKGMLEKAIGMYERSIALSPNYREALVNLGVAYTAAGRTGEALEAFERALAVDPKNSVIYVNLALTFSGAGRPDKAAEYYRKAIEVNALDSKAFHGLGTAYVKMGMLDDALAAYTNFVLLSPDDPEAYRNRGNVYAYKGDFTNAGADFQKACSMGSQESCNYLRDTRFR